MLEEKLQQKYCSKALSTGPLKEKVFNDSSSDMSRNDFNGAPQLHFLREGFCARVRGARGDDYNILCRYVKCTQHIIYIDIRKYMESDVVLLVDALQYNTSSRITHIMPLNTN